MVTRGHAGYVRLGCLLPVLLIAVLAYAGLAIGDVHLRAYRYRDAMAQQSRFADRTSDAEIVNRLRAKADSLGLPEGAQRIGVQRSERAISIWAEYVDTVDLHLVKRAVRFSPHVEREW